MNVSEAKEALDNLIRKSRVHLYKPIQIAEILYHDRMQGGLDLNNLETYRNTSKAWRNAVTSRFVGRNSNSSARYQDDLFNENAISPRLLALLGQENRAKGGIVEAYIYRRFTERFSQMTSALDYLNDHGRQTFDILQFINLFWHNPGLRRSIDKIYEITVFALFSVLVEAMEVFVTIGINGDKTDMLTETQSNWLEGPDSKHHYGERFVVVV